MKISRKLRNLATSMGALDQLVHVKALGTKQRDYGVGLGLDGPALYNGIIRALGYIPALISEVGVKGEIVTKKEGTISDLLQILEALSIFSLDLNIGWVILISRGETKLATREFYITDNHIHVGDGHIDF